MPVVQIDFSWIPEQLKFVRTRCGPKLFSDGLFWVFTSIWYNQIYNVAIRWSIAMA
jgi:hypothetical protein